MMVLNRKVSGVWFYLDRTYFSYLCVQMLASHLFTSFKRAARVFGFLYLFKKSHLYGFSWVGFVIFFEFQFNLDYCRVEKSPIQLRKNWFRLDWVVELGSFCHT